MFSCGLCGAEFAHWKNLAIHRNDSKAYCNFCNKVFDNKKSFDDHLKECFLRSNNFNECLNCGGIFFRRWFH